MPTVSFPFGRPALLVSRGVRMRMRTRGRSRDVSGAYDCTQLACVACQMLTDDSLGGCYSHAARLIRDLVASKAALLLRYPDCSCSSIVYGELGRGITKVSVVVRRTVRTLAMSMLEVLQLKPGCALTNHRISVPTQRATCRIAESV
jgi:hypothetical protein